ncbi:hypothetical protein Q3V23_19085 [Streptomyces sp. VNUA116]|uniref:hypothetical protein n=1 Tax=Streptomyces sp. VNUA116 TaxID=3062449 RepID=UPI002674D94E|nr:hypothetical protein [Streptomyces sp. VNUA116]WKU45995.1 hypothetical protein Q3V23_19085 [Streptomyces sp. VNUA116]
MTVIALADRQHQPQHLAAPALPRMSVESKLDYCRAFAASGLLPRQYRQQPANLLYAVEYAESLGLHPMVAITGVHVIEGKPSASSALISALVRRAGHRLRIKGDATAAVAQIIRSDDPDWTFEIRFTIEDARRAGLLGKDVWQKYPAAMLKARALSAAARDACEEALFGVHYTPEELGAVVDQEGNPIYVAGEIQRDTAEAPAAPVAAPPRDFLTEAEQAVDAAAVRQVWDQAKAVGAPQQFLDQLAAIGRDKPGARVVEQPAEDVVEGKVVEQHQDDDQEHAAALGELYDAGSDVGMSKEETREAFTARFPGQTPEQAPLDAVRAMRDDLLDAADGGAE